MFKIIVCENYEEMSKKAFSVIRDIVVENPKAVLGLATGSSPVGLYQLMIEDHQKNGTSYKDVTTFNLDEYLGIAKDHPQSYYTFMHENLFKGLDIKEENIHIPSGSGDVDQQAANYESLLADNMIDVQVLGIGRNGHIGFNEPGTPFDALTHIVKLKENTRKDNARFFDSLDEVPTHAITMGSGTIMQRAKKVLMIASGEAKQDAIYNMIKGPITTDLPASILQKHDDVVVILDKAAAAKL
ncbi:MAG: glucosamine-6-phosphate deaminase [Erysipelotrichaceae bacterium]|nr:glucosamine-6-phosphate deaminase [Erysipelotrichaceae bacterium]